MHPFPHRYTVQAHAKPDGDVPLQAPSLPTLMSSPPAEFDGPGDRWSPETLLCAALLDCFVLSFRAVARASKLEWNDLDCNIEGTLDRVEGKSYFTDFVVHATLRVPTGTDRDKATKAMVKAEQVCLISNSLVARRHLEPTVIVG